MNRRDFLMFRTEGRTRTVELSCERLYMQFVDSRTLPDPEETASEGGEPPARFEMRTTRELFDDLARELTDVDIVRVTQTEWLAADEFGREVEALLHVVRARGTRVDYR
jgi:hypothetical protein